MVETKKIKDEELEQVNGGLIFVDTRYPVASDFYDQVGDRTWFYVYFPSCNKSFNIEFEVVGLGYKVTGTKFDRIFASLYYKLQTVDRSLCEFDGWYGSNGLFGSRDKISEDGMVVVV